MGGKTRLIIPAGFRGRGYGRQNQVDIPFGFRTAGLSKRFCQNKPRQHLRASRGRFHLLKNNGRYYTGLYYILRRNSQKYSCKPMQNNKNKLFLKKYNFLKKSLAMPINSMYTNPCCGMIAVKREVAGFQQWRSGFPWSECQVRKLTASHCTN